MSEETKNIMDGATENTADISSEEMAKMVEDDKASKQAEKEKVKEMKKEDPLAGVKLGSEEIFKSLCLISRGDKNAYNMHDVVLYAAGLAGYSCQAAVFETQIIRDKKDFNEIFHVVVSPNGDKYIFGDATNDYLFGNNHSVYNMLTSMYKFLYPNGSVPPVAPIIKKVTANIVNPDYKVVGEMPPSQLSQMFALIWKNTYPKLRTYCPNPEEWPVLFAMVLQRGLGQSKGVVDPNMLMNFMMEAAVFASKADLGSKAR